MWHSIIFFSRTKPGLTKQQCKNIKKKELTSPTRLGSGSFAAGPGKGGEVCDRVYTCAATAAMEDGREREKKLNPIPSSPPIPPPPPARILPHPRRRREGPVGAASSPCWSRLRAHGRWLDCLVSVRIELGGIARSIDWAGFASRL